MGTFADADELEIEWSADLFRDPYHGPAQLSELYLALYNTGRLPVQEVVVLDGENPTKTAIRAGAWSSWLGGEQYGNAELDALLCVLNSDVCRLEITDAAEDYTDIANHINGYKVPTASWFAKREHDKLVIPAIKVNESYEVERLTNRVLSESYLPVASEDSFKAINCLGGLMSATNCVALEERNARWFSIAGNPNVVAFDARNANKESLNRHVLEEYASETSQVTIAAVPVISVELKVGEKQDWSSEPLVVPNFVVPDEDLSLLKSAIENNAYFSTDFVPQYSVASGVSDEQKKYLDLVGALSKDGERIVLEEPREFPRLGHIDKPADLFHCYFSGRVQLFNISLSDPTPVSASQLLANLDETERKFSKLDDYKNCNKTIADAHPKQHGTHTLGILVDMLTQGKSDIPSEMQPRIYHIPVKDTHRISGTLVGSIARSIKSLRINEGVQIFNMSGRFADQNVGKKFYRELRKLKDVVLVVSAGNEEKADDIIEGSCLPEPACHNAPYIWSVIGVILTDDGNFKPHELSWVGQDNHEFGSSWKMLSTIEKNAWSVMEGTSQAAPFIAALAEQIRISGEAEVSRDEIKHHMIYTSKFPTHASPHFDIVRNSAQAPLIDFGRAVLWNFATLDLKQPDCFLIGKFVRITHGDNVFALTEINGQQKVPINASNIRRLKDLGDNDSLLVYWKRGKGKYNQSELSFDTGAAAQKIKFRISSSTGECSYGTNVVEEFDLSNIDDLIVPEQSFYAN